MFPTQSVTEPRPVPTLFARLTDDERRAFAPYLHTQHHRRGAFLFHVGAEPTGKGQQHDGEEMFLVLSGTVEMRTPDRSYVLEAGDSAYFPGHLRHQMRRIGPEPATAVIAVARERSSARRNQATEDVSQPSAAARRPARSADSA